MSIQWAISQHEVYTFHVLTERLTRLNVCMCVCTFLLFLPPSAPLSACVTLSSDCCIILSCLFKLSTILTVVHFYLTIHCWFYRWFYIKLRKFVETISNCTLALKTNPIGCCRWFSQLFDIFVFWNHHLHLIECWRCSRFRCVCISFC